MTIDRQALVTRHNIVLTQTDPLTPLSVGNGEFAFTADITGLQTFPAFYEQGMPLGTQAQWGWHSLPNTQNYRLEDTLVMYTVAGRGVPYASGMNGEQAYTPAAEWLRANPHRLHLGRIGLNLIKSNGTPTRIEDIQHPYQVLNLWEGLLDSVFEFEGHPAHVQTLCHPQHDMLAVRIESSLLKQHATLQIAFPYGSTQWRNAADWTHPERHTTQAKIKDGRAILTRRLDADAYIVGVRCSDWGSIRALSEHTYEIGAGGQETLDVVFAFASGESPPDALAGGIPPFDEVTFAAATYWEQFWNSGGAVDFSGATDPRAAELERRVVLSQYLTTIHCAGSAPPQETGLICNSWFGKAHLEMYWWHAAHFALWDRLPLLERSMPWYQAILPKAQASAARQGYPGARWPKMVGPDGQDSPSEIAVFLIWQQPHPIYCAELCYRAHPNRETLEKYRQIVFETATFMAAYPVWDNTQAHYVLGPAMIPAQESYGSTCATNLNPTFELAYWHWALDTAQQWRERLGLGRHPLWEKILRNLAPPNISDGVYTGIATPPYTIPHDHPSMLAALGLLPHTPLIDVETMQRTYVRVMETWDWTSTWGWDYPMLAMTAARLGEPEKAVEALFITSEKNRYLANGHNYQSARLPLYLPGNGGLLAAIAMMAAGWDGCPERANPGFPDNGTWSLHWEGLKRMP
ncbi:MAG: hypothetical protein JXA21_14670 [Anaerolineae bacterium]|nr:hypothetical protein [Anaerolineae bacterium]